MALQAPFHVERIFPPHEWHLFHLAVTGRATDALAHMNAVVEINEPGKIMDPRPFQRLSSAPAISHRLEHRTGGPNLTVAIHTDLRGRNAGESRLLDRSMAIATIDAGVADVVFVAEGYGLNPGHADFRDVRRSTDGSECANRDAQKNQTAEDRYLGNRVRAGMENLRHRPTPSRRSRANLALGAVHETIATNSQCRPLFFHPTQDGAPRAKK